MSEPWIVDPNSPMIFRSYLVRMHAHNLKRISKWLVANQSTQAPILKYLQWHIIYQREGMGLSFDKNATYLNNYQPNCYITSTRAQQILIPAD